MHVLILIPKLQLYIKIMYYCQNTKKAFYLEYTDCDDFPHTTPTKWMLNIVC